MRKKRYYVNREDGTTNLPTSFLSCEKDVELIIRQLFVESMPYSDELKRLLIIPNKDCLDDRTNPAYLKKLQETSIADLIDGQYIRLQPNLKFGENEELKSYIIISFDGFTPTSNDQFRDCTVEIDILCNLDTWDLGNYRQRPIKIMGYIDGILNKTNLTGIGTLEFVSANELILSETLAGYCLMYRAVHGSDDIIPWDDEEEEDEE